MLILLFIGCKCGVRVVIFGWFVGGVWWVVLNLISYFFLFNWLIIGVLCVDFQISTFECAYLERVVWGDIGVCYLVENL